MLIENFKTGTMERWGLGQEVLLRRFPRLIHARGYEVTDANMDLLKSHGFTEDDIWDIAAISAFFGMSNRLANVSNMRANDEFYAMGR